LQAAHVITDMFCEYSSSKLKTGSLLYKWAADHKTIILLNGGNTADLNELADFFLDSDENPYPYGYFKEDKQSLNESITSVGIILPAEIYDTAAEDRRQGGTNWQKLSTFGFEPGQIGMATRPALSKWQNELISRLNQCSLAK
jgi:hypothetical protein